jgi:hypothetical protein
MMLIKLQPDPPPDALEKKIRIGCGSVFGICVGLYVAAAWVGLKSAWVWPFVLVGAVVFARIALVHGHHFWLGLVDAIRQMMKNGG